MTSTVVKASIVIVIVIVIIILFLFIIYMYGKPQHKNDNHKPKHTAANDLSDDELDFDF